MTMTHNARQFAADIARQRDRFTRKQFGFFMQKIVLDILEKVVYSTRVDTGRLRGGWQVEIGGDPKEEAIITQLVSGGALRDSAGRFTTESSNVDPRGDATVARGLAKINQLIGNPFQLVVIANNVEYAIYIEEGTDKFPGDHMLRNALALVAATLR